MDFTRNILEVFNPDKHPEIFATGKGGYKTYGPGETIHFEGDPCTRLVIIASGTVAIERLDPSGSLLPIVNFDAGHVISANLLFSSAPRYPLTVRAVANVKLLWIHPDGVLALCQQDPQFLQALLGNISDHTVILSGKIRDLVNQPLREKLLRYLHAEVKRQGQGQGQDQGQAGATVVLSTSKKLLAEILGVQRTSLSRELAKMVDEGLIRVAGRRITFR